MMLELLRRHVRRSPNGHSRRSWTHFIHQPCDTKISQASYAIRSNQHVRRLDITVDNTVLMNISECACKRRPDLRGATGIQRSACGKLGCEVWAIDQVHDQIGFTICHACIQETHKGWMRQAGKSRCLGDETVRCRWAAKPDQLQSNRAIMEQVVSTPHLPHPSPGKAILQLIPAP
jgi:hypothetical protein